MAALLCALMVTASAQSGTEPPEPPAISTDGDAITITASRLVYQRSGEPASASEIVTRTDMSAEIESVSVECREVIGEERLEWQAALAAAAATTSALNGSLSSARAEITTLRADAEAIRTALRVLAAALDARLPPTNVTCAPYVLLNGQTLGHQDHVSPGAVRTLRCDPGFMLNGSAAQHQDGDSLVICNADGSWSNNRRARCIREPATGAPSTPPTRSPVDYEEVTCCATANSNIYSFFGDGTRLRDYGAGATAISRERGWLVKFPSTTSVLALTARSTECGCNCGYIFLFCGTPSGEGAWNFATPGLGAAHGNAHDAASGRFSVFSKWYDSGPNFPSWVGANHLASTTGTFSQPQFDAVAAGFEPARGALMQHMAARLNFNNSYIASHQCPSIPSEYRTTLGTVCGGPDHNRQLGSRGIQWWLRYDSRGRI